MTNNATLSRNSYKTKLDKLGIPASVVCHMILRIPWRLWTKSSFSLIKDEIFGSAYAAAVFLSSVLKFPKDKKVYLIGMEGLEEELRNEGINYAGGTVC